MHAAFEARDMSFQKRTFDRFVPERNGKRDGNYLFYNQKCADPRVKSNPGAGFGYRSRKRLGIAEQYSPRLANIPDDKWDETIENLHREAYEKWASREEIAPFNPPGWEEFQKKPVFRWQVDEPYYTYKNADSGAGESL